MKALLIKQCPDGLRWYRDLVGQCVPFINDTGTEYRSREPAGYTNFVQYEDAEIVEEQKAMSQTPEKNNYGTLTISTDLYRNNISLVAKALAAIEFAPTRLEHNFMKDQFFIEGFSKSFKEIPEGNIAPQYYLEITNDEIGNLTVHARPANSNPAEQEEQKP